MTTTRYPSLRPLVKASIRHFGQCLSASLMYRGALILFLISEGVAYAGFIAFWYQAAEHNPTQKLYSGLGLVLYFLLALFHHGIQHHTATRDLGGDIRLGKLSYALIRPYPFLLHTVIKSVAFSVTYIILLVPLVMVSLWFTPGLAAEFGTHLSGTVMIQYAVALALSLVSGWILRVAVGLLAFDMSQIWGPDTMLIAVYSATSGAVFPVDLLPQWALKIAQWTPCYYMVGLPTLTIMGRVPEAEFWQLASRGVMVTAGVLVVMTLMWRRGIRRFEAIGI